MAPILSRIERSPERANILRVTDANDADLVALYSACTAVAFPSLAEGFGLPLLESMACGAACVTSDHPALLELGAGGGAIAVPTLDEEALAAALIAFWRDPTLRERTAASGVERAAVYRFEPWAEQMFALYRRELECAGSRGAGR
jgi:glycosyltransferase involved in cell wall biosynthesis